MARVDAVQLNRGNRLNNKQRPPDRDELRRGADAVLDQQTMKHRTPHVESRRSLAN